MFRYTGAGFAGGLILGAALDYPGFQRSGQWRTLAGEGESVFEGFYALRHRLSGSTGTMAEAYGWGKFFGMLVPWLIDWGSRLAGVDVYGVAGFYIPYFYALSDQPTYPGCSSSLGGKEHGERPSLTISTNHPVMLASLTIIYL